MRRLLSFVSMVFFLALPVAQPAAAADRVALVIGNSKYQHSSPVALGADNARAMAGMLRGIGCEVTETVDADRNAMKAAIERFGLAAADAKTVVIYYSGQGVQVSGTTYFVPIDAKLDAPADLVPNAIALDDVLSSVAKARVALLFLDAGRTSPFRGQQPLAPRRGGAEPNEMLLSFATGPDLRTVDGAGPTSAYTAALIRRLPVPGVAIRQALAQVRSDVLQATGNRQTPWDHSTLGDDVVLVPAKR